jgi:hypothetical protein
MRIEIRCLIVRLHITSDTGALGEGLHVFGNYDTYHSANGPLYQHSISDRRGLAAPSRQACATLYWMALVNYSFRTHKNRIPAYLARILSAAWDATLQSCIPNYTCNYCAVKFKLALYGPCPAVFAAETAHP